MRVEWPSRDQGFHPCQKAREALKEITTAMMQGDALETLNIEYAPQGPPGAQHGHKGIYSVVTGM